ncbi:hypothetical protein I546_5519 [Mycobacterium kansasii 732]|nr:hypothetical protein I546_5519 [Mycobacterium kansasii 732]
MPRVARLDVIEENDSAAESSSDANVFQAAAASNIGVEPAPENIRAELISGGSTEKFIAHLPSSPDLSPPMRL